MNLQEELKALKERITELEKLAKEEQEFPQNGNDYWYVDDDAEVMGTVWYGDDSDQGRVSIDNVFKTEEEAEFVGEKLKVEAELRKFSSPFKPWSNNHVVTFTSRGDLEKKMWLSLIIKVLSTLKVEEKPNKLLIQSVKNVSRNTYSEWRANHENEYRTIRCVGTSSQIRWKTL